MAFATIGCNWHILSRFVWPFRGGREITAVIPLGRGSARPLADGSRVKVGVNRPEREYTWKAPIFAVLLSLASSAPVLAGTFVYVSNAEDGDIGMYTPQADSSLQPGQRFKAAKLVMPMAVSPDKRFLIAAVRSKPFQVDSYGIDKNSGALNLVGTERSRRATRTSRLIVAAASPRRVLRR